MPGRKSFDVSVVIPLFDKADYIREAVDSVVAQSYPATEIIVVDDGSTDDSAERIRDLAEGTVRIVAQNNAGPASARNRGVAEASCSWIAFLDADDIWLGDHLKTLAEVAQAFPEAAVVGSNFALDNAAFPESSRTEARLVDFFAVAQPGFFCASSVAIRRSAFQASGGFGSFWPGEDVDLWTRLALEHPIAISPKTTALYRQETGGLMDQSNGRFGERFEMSPILFTLEAALADDKYTSRHGAIARYRDQWLAIFARQALVGGRPQVASAYLRQMQPSSREGGPLIRVLARLPRPLVSAVMQVRSGLRGFRGNR